MSGMPFLVRSADGTSIAVWVDGSGPPFVLVHGSLGDHTTFERLVGELRNHVTTFSMDRRGRGASGDGAGEYSIEREFEDVAAVVDVVASRAGHSVAIWGHSYGASCVMGGAALTRQTHHVVLYESGLGAPYSAASIEAVEEQVAAGDNEGAMVSVLVEVVEMSLEEVEILRSSPLWSTRLTIVPTMPRELRAEAHWVYRPGQFDLVTSPTLILTGSESPPAQDEANDQALSALPNARIRVLEGHGHIAHQTDPAMVAGVLLDFIAS